MTGRRGRRRGAPGVAFLLALAALLATWTEPALGQRAEIVLDEQNQPQVRAALPCDRFRGKPAKTAVLFVFGQSNAGNHGEGAVIGRTGLANFYVKTGLCYSAQDPLLGSTGTGSGPWVRLGNYLLGQNVFTRVLLVSIAVGGTTIAQWAPGGDVHPHLMAALARLKDNGIDVTHFLWHQGESDAGVRRVPGAYRASMLALADSIRAKGFGAKIYVAQATVCDIHGGVHERSSPEVIAQPAAHAAKSRAQDGLRQEIAALVGSRPDLALGPDTDKIDASLRYDGCHFGSAGLDQHALMWFSVLTGLARSPGGDTLAKLLVLDPHGNVKFTRVLEALSRADCEKWRRMLLDRAAADKLVLRDRGFVYASGGDTIEPSCQPR